jgi:hypothetical protein
MKPGKEHDVEREQLETLIDVAGSGEALAAWLGVTPAAVSAWRRGGEMSQQSEEAVAMIQCRWRNRWLFTYGWMMERTTSSRSRDFRLIVERAEGDALDPTISKPDVRRQRGLDFTKAERDEAIRTLVRSYMDHDMLADGDVLVFFKPGETWFAYIDQDQVRPAFTRRTWEPWWPLRRFIQDRR